MSSQTNFNSHFVGFIDSFIKPEYQSRWKHILIDKPEKSVNELKKFERHLNDSVCKLIESSEIELLKQTLVKTIALYYDGESDPQFLSVSEAISHARRNSCDSIISIIPGKETIFVFHEGWGWHCKKN